MLPDSLTCVVLYVCRSSWVDVRDLARAHVLSLTTEAAGGNRIIVAVGPFKWQDWGKSS